MGGSYRGEMLGGGSNNRGEMMGGHGNGGAVFETHLD